MLENLEKIIAQLKSNDSSLKKLDFSKEIEVFGTKIIERTSKTIDLKIDKKTLKQITEALEQNIYLEALDLRNNKIDDEGAEILAQMLEKNSHLKTLRLDFNLITGKGIQVLAKALEKNESLRTITIDNNKIGEEGGKALAEMLRVNTSLGMLSANQSGIGVKGAQLIAQGLIKNSSLRDLTLSFNAIGDEGAQAIAKALERNTTLKMLFIESCTIGEIGETALATSLEKNTSLTLLYFREQVNCKHCEDISTYIARNQGLNASKNVVNATSTTTASLSTPTPVATKAQAEQVRREILKLFAAPEGQLFTNAFATSCWGDTLRMESVLMIEKVQGTDNYCLKIADDCFEQSFFIDARYAYAETKAKPLLLDYAKKHMDNCYYPGALKKLESAIHEKWNDTTQRTSRIWRERKNCDVGYTYSLEISPQNVKRIFAELSSHQSSISNTESSAVEKALLDRTENLLTYSASSPLSQPQASGSQASVLRSMTSSSNSSTPMPIGFVPTLKNY